MHPQESSSEAKVPPEYVGIRLDRAVTALLGGGVSRTRIQGWIREGRLTLDGEVLDQPGFLCEKGQSLVLSIPEPQVPEPGSPFEPVLLYEDKHLAVIDKPAGLPMHGHSLGDARASVATWLVDKYGKHLPIAQGAERPGIVHRLDRDTSGVCVVAFDTCTFEDLMAQFAERSVEKEYRALAYGQARFQSDWIEKRLKADVRRPDLVRTTTSMAKGTRDARTFWEVLEAFDGFVWLRVKPYTGRKHQIRAHLSSIDLPIVGDPFYKARNYGPGMFPPGAPEVDRTLLHAHAITFEHPVTGERKTYRSEPAILIQDFLKALFHHANR